MRTNIDTGAIIAPVFMLSRSIDLGAKLFSNWRYTMDGAEIPDFVLNQPRYRKAQILLAGPNFGCGSSREGAVWALMRFGIRCVIAPSFGEIFYSNACQNGLLPVTLPEATVHQLAEAMTAALEPVLTVDLNRCVVQPPSGAEISFAIAGDRRLSFLEGLDETSLILRHEDEIDAFQQRARAAQPWLFNARGGSLRAGCDDTRSCLRQPRGAAGARRPGCCANQFSQQAGAHRHSVRGRRLCRHHDAAARRQIERPTRSASDR
jgi:3-isopropylmalate/(R)-2-methylmalate dehydratase small subunit